jgi:hypothetical protein
MQPSTSAGLTPLRVLAQLGGAIVVGVAIAVVLYFLLGFLLLGAGLGMGLLSIQIFGMVIGFGVGAGLGVGLVGRWQGLSGNLWLTMLAGGITGAMVILVLRLLNIGGFGGILAAGLLLALIDAVLVYNLTVRR